MIDFDFIAAKCGVDLCSCDGSCYYLISGNWDVQFIFQLQNSLGLKVTQLSRDGWRRKLVVCKWVQVEKYDVL
ncbi:hypothetical protein L1887_10123 [Cichorium endivia]|nr:hypothetical protein L1887_10123 [Cichorium endivia]